MADILFLAHRVPFPPDRGDRIRSFHILRALCRLACVHVVAFADDARDAQAGRGLESVRQKTGAGNEEVGLASLTIVRRTRGRAAAAALALLTGRPISVVAFDSHAMRRAVAAVLAREAIDTVYAFSGQMAQFVPADARRFVMDFVDVDSAKFEAYGARRSLLAPVHAREGRRLAAFERAVAARADVSLFVSEAEAALFRARTGLPAAKIAVLGNGIDLARFDPGQAPAPLGGHGPLIVFTGQMDYPPNVEAVDGFARTQLPAIRRRHPHARFAIVGRQPTSTVTALAALPGVVVTGEVADVRGWLAAADVVVAPLRIARGIQNKVLEALAMARAVVVSPGALEGIAAEPGLNLILADEAHQADSVSALLDDPARRHALGAAARRLVELRYGWDRALAPLAGLVGREPPSCTAVAA